MLHLYIVSTLAMTALLPFCLAMGTSGVMIYHGNRRRGGALAELGIGLGFLGGYVALAGGLPFVDDLPNGVIGEIALVVMAPALILGLWMPGPRPTRWLIAILAAGAIVWTLRGGGFALATLADIATAVVGVLAALTIAFRLHALGQGSAVPVLILACVALGLAGIAYCAQTPVFTGLFTIMAASLAGFLVWCRPFAKRPVGAAGLAIALTLMLVLALEFWRNAAVTPWGLLVVALAFWADGIAERLPVLAKRSRRRTERPVVLISVAMLCCMVGVGLAALLSRFYPAQ